MSLVAGLLDGSLPAHASQPGIFVTVPWAIAGERIEADGSRRWYPGDWPTIPVSGIRIWDARTAWLNIEQTPGRYSFDRLDAFVAKAESRGVDDIVLVLGGTPRWAASQVSPEDAPWLGPGSASPPRKLSDWSGFVHAVAQRYRGRIDTYEIWNEPNSRTYWSGSIAQWAQLVMAARASISSADPGASVIASGFATPSGGSVAGLTPWVKALASAGCDQCLDAISFHWYPRSGGSGGALALAVSSVDAIAVEAGIASSVWVTEMNVRGGASLPPRSQARQARALRDAAAESGAARAYWYAWTDLDPSGLLPLFRGRPAARVLAGRTG